MYFADLYCDISRTSRDDCVVDVVVTRPTVSNITDPIVTDGTDAIDIEGAVITAEEYAVISTTSSRYNADVNVIELPFVAV
jgi:hypothetical protein